MKFGENVLPHVIGSGAEKTMQRNANKIVSKGNELFSKMSGGETATNYGVELQNALKLARKKLALQKMQVMSL